MDLSLFYTSSDCLVEAESVFMAAAIFEIGTWDLSFLGSAWTHTWTNVKASCTDAVCQKLCQKAQGPEHHRLFQAMPFLHDITIRVFRALFAGEFAVFTGVMRLERIISTKRLESGAKKSILRHVKAAAERTRRPFRLTLEVDLDI